MPFINDSAFDAAVAWVVANGTALSLCSQEPTTYADATSTYELAVDTSVTCPAASNGASTGRRTVVPAADCVGNAAGTATHWALHDNAGVLVATGPLSVPFSVIVGVTYTTNPHSITIADAQVPA